MHLAATAAAAVAGCGHSEPQPLRRAEAAAPGRHERIEHFRSRHVDPRPVQVWLPPGYDPQRERYAVLYMHDGQMLFDPSSTWNRKAWRAGAIAAAGMASGPLRPFIIVGPWNIAAHRHAEYFPQRFLDHIADHAMRDRLVHKQMGGRSRSDAYQRFLVEELKPAIDRRYATLPEREHTAVMGSSMGGLASIYAACEYPATWGGAAALSTHWIGTYERNADAPAAALSYLQQALPPAGSMWLWTDRGTKGLDALYDDAQANVDSLLTRRGWARPHWVSRVFEGADHDENAWADRLHLPLAHLLPSARTPQ